MNSDLIKDYKMEINFTGSEHISHLVRGHVFTLDKFIQLLKKKNTTIQLFDVKALQEITSGAMHLEEVMRI